jgi:DNA-binding MarR family transcriptional regulator
VTSKLSVEELGAYFALVTAGDLVQRAVSAQFSEHGLTSLQFSLLARLLDAPEGLRMSDLADELVVSRSGLTYQATQLEKSGLIERVSSPTDSRGVVARLTEAGRVRVLETFPGHVELVRSNFLDLLTPKEVTSIRATLEKVVARLRHGAP